MKKLALIAVVAGFAFTSCKKDYTCACKDSSGDSVATGSFKASKKDATDSCDALETQWKAYDSSTSCTLSKS